MKNLGIGMKMALLVAVLLATAIVIAVVGLTQLTRLSTTFDQLLNVDSKAIEVADNVRIALLSAIRAEKNAILAAKAEDANTFATTARAESHRALELRDQLAALLPQTTGSSGAAAGAKAVSLTDFDREFEEFRRNQEEVLKLAVVKSEAQANGIVYGEFQ